MTIALTMNDAWASIWSIICGVIEQMRVLSRDTTLPAEDGGYVRNP